LCSDHLPVLGKFSVYMTIPSFEDVEKTLDQNLKGKLIYNKFVLDYDFTDVFSELELEPKYPLKLKLLAYYFINKNSAECKSIEIKVIIKY
jgi:hypothetical protein